MLFQVLRLCVSATETQVRVRSNSRATFKAHLSRQQWQRVFTSRSSSRSPFARRNPAIKESGAVLAAVGDYESDRAESIRLRRGLRLRRKNSGPLSDVRRSTLSAAVRHASLATFCTRLRVRVRVNVQHSFTCKIYWKFISSIIGLIAGC